jgi:hypothetical protein
MANYCILFKLYLDEKSKWGVIWIDKNEVLEYDWTADCIEKLLHGYGVKYYEITLSDVVWWYTVYIKTSSIITWNSYYVYDNDSLLWLKIYLDNQQY